jgi:branched-chain amino acid transport system ATP-binding protein
MDRAFRMFPRLKERESQKAGTLSGGEQQMLAIGRALMSNPRLLLLDEPSLGLAPLVVHTIFQAIDEIKSKGTTILLVEQNAHAALGHSDRAYVLETGRIVMEGPSKDLANDPRIKEAYLGE